MAIDPNSDISFAELVGSYTHIDNRSDYRRRFDEAARATSTQDKRRNQTIKYLRQALLYECAVQAVRLPGDFAECGCFRGQSAFMLATMIWDAGSAATLHAFDSFEGLSPFQPEDSAGLERSADREEQMRRHFAWPAERFEQSMRPFGGRVRAHPGWIPARFPEVAGETFALVHIDVDLYQPTRDSLEFFYPRMVEGGWLVIDDYNSRPYPGANKAVDDFVQAVHPAAAIAGQVGGFAIRK